MHISKIVFSKAKQQHSTSQQHSMISITKHIEQKRKRLGTLAESAEKDEEEGKSGSKGTKKSSSTSKEAS